MEKAMLFLSSYLSRVTSEWFSDDSEVSLTDAVMRRLKEVCLARKR
jgi:hypothetical protein